MGWIPAVLEADRRQREVWQDEDALHGFDRDHGGPPMGGCMIWMVAGFLLLRRMF